MKRLLLGTSIFVVALGSLAAGAQDTDAPDTDAGDEEGAMSQIIVTARFREESAQDIGQSIRAFGQQEIEGAGILDFSDIARRTPGLDFNDRGPNANEVSIRGISKLVSQSTLDILPSQTVVTQFVDDIPTTSPNSRQRDFHLFDFNRVEILRGPQPTYFGEGSVGGTIRYFSAD
ncbi:MAG: Plug domain-containing protein, partial [Sphingomonadales bacterium]|nr:Plug domain-containing protein [Sphingomonadales bacterium]